MNTQTTRKQPAVHLLTFIVVVALALLVGLAVGAAARQTSTPKPVPTVTVTPEPAADICADAAAELEAHGQRMVSEVVVPLMFEDADPESAEMRDALASVMADYEATYWDAQQVCNGGDPVEFEQ